MITDQNQDGGKEQVPPTGVWCAGWFKYAGVEITSYGWGGGFGVALNNLTRRVAAGKSPDETIGGCAGLLVIMLEAVFYG